MPEWIHARRAILLVSWFIVGGIVGCTERRDSPVGIDLIDSGRQGEGPLEWVISADRDSTFEESLNTGAGSELLIGSEGLTRLRTLLRFSDLPAADSVIRATVKFRRAEGYSAGSFDVEAFPVVAEWQETRATWEFASEDSMGESVPWVWPGGDFDPVEAGRFTFRDEEGDTLFELDIDPRLVHDWIDGGRPNEGLILVSASEGLEDHLASFVSRQSEDIDLEPVLDLEYIPSDEPDTTLTTEIPVSNDVFISFFEGVIDLARPLLGDVPTFRTLLRFDLSGFDSSWTIIRADLDLHISDAAHLHDDLVVEANAVLSAWAGPDTERDTAILGSTTVSSGDSSLELNLTGIVQLWVSGDFENEGVILRMGRTTDDFGYLVLDGVASASQERRPALRIVYHIPGDPPFGDMRPEDKKSMRTAR
jgi:hypothetical protein